MIDNLQSSSGRRLWPSGRRLSADDGEYQDKIDALEREVASVKAEQQAVLGLLGSDVGQTW